MRPAKPYARLAERRPQQRQRSGHGAERVVQGREREARRAAVVRLQGRPVTHKPMSSSERVLAWLTGRIMHTTS
jgi:hypothetical protein